MQLDPSLALTYHRRGLLYAMQGDIDRALAASERAQQLEPLWLAPKGRRRQFPLLRDDATTSRSRLLEQVLALDERADNARASLIRNLIVKGRLRIAQLRSTTSIRCKRPAATRFARRRSRYRDGAQAALAELDRVLKLSKERYVAAYDIALIYAALADTENAFLWLERALEDRSTLINFLAQDPMLDALHGDPRLAALVRRIGIYGRVLPDASSVPK